MGAVQPPFDELVPVGVDTNRLLYAIYLALSTGGTPGSGTVTSVNVSGGTTGMSFSGGPITGSGTMTMSGTLAIANGGTGATNATAATAQWNAMVGDSGAGGTKGLVPAPAAGDAAAGKFLKADGVWTVPPGGGGGSPGGSSTQVQYNNAGAFGGISGATSNGTTLTITSGRATTDFSPTSNDGATLGTTALQFSDLYLAEGGVINWDNGDATLTQTGNGVYLGGASLGVGTGSTVSANIHSLSTTEQLRLGYDASNYVSFAVSSGGALTATAAGAGSDINMNLVPKGAGRVQSDGLAMDPYTVQTASGTTLTLAATDAQTYIRLTNASACDITLPNDSTVTWLDNTEIAFRIANTGIPTFTLGGGVTLNGSGNLASMVQNNTFAIKRVAANTWDLI